MAHNGFLKEPQAGFTQSVASRATVGLLLERMKLHEVYELWGLHGVPFAVGSKALLPLCGSKKRPDGLALLSAHRSPDSPDEIWMGFAVADSERDQDIGAPLLVPSSEPPDFSDVLRDAPGFSTLACYVGADRNAYRNVTLFGERGAGREPVPLEVDELTILVFLALVVCALDRDVQALVA